MLDYQTITIMGDLSRLDVKVLIDECTDKNVVEFGCGGSTIIAAMCAKSVTSYDTDQVWVDRTLSKLSKLTGLSCTPTINTISSTPLDIPECDVLFIDGLGGMRSEWMQHFPKCKTMLIHDSLGDTGNGPTIYHVMSSLMLTHTNVQLLDKILFHHQNSNMVVVRRRAEPIYYQNWNETEPENRIDPYSN